MHYGYDHPRSVDIDEIRELLRGYGSEESLLKELIQNAEDANATWIRFVLLEGEPGSPHPLLRHRGLCVINDGAFRPEHLAAMRRLRVGTKGRDTQAIGRFGKGLKSVFAICEAFFVVAATSREHGWNELHQCHFFNPRSGWRHELWDRHFATSQLAIRESMVARFQTELPATWLAVWLPLRHPEHLVDGEHSIAPIFRQERAAALNDQLGRNLDFSLRRLAPSLVTLRNLQRVEVADYTRGGAVTWRADRGSVRPTAPGECEPTPVRGKVTLVNGSSESDFVYFGLAGTEAGDRAESIRQQSDWPETLLLENDEPVDEKAKAVPHFGIFITSTQAAEGRLRVSWAVFLPVGQQPPGIQDVRCSDLGHELTVTIHGFGFLDPQRTKVDWLDSAFTPKERPTSRACLEWNKFLFEETALQRIPEVLAVAAAELKLSIRQIQQVVDAIRQTWLWHKFSQACCRRKRWVLRWNSSGREWCLVDAALPLRRLPYIDSFTELTAAIPQLAKFLDQNQVMQVGAPVASSGLLADSPTSLTADEIIAIVNGASRDSLPQESVEWLNQVLSEHAADTSFSDSLTDAIRDLRLIQVTRVRLGHEEEKQLSLAAWQVPNARVFQKNSDRNLLSALLRALPGFDCLLVDESGLPSWLPIRNINSLGPRDAAVLILGSTLGPPADRVGLAKALLSHVQEPVIRSAIRYLVHGRADHIEDAAWLLLPSDGTDAVWERLIQHLVPTPSWRVLARAWSGIFSANDLSELLIAPLNAEGAWAILSDATTEWLQKAFNDDWSENDLRRILEGLWHAGARNIALTKCLLRRLPIHALRSDVRSRTAIADADGSLERRYILDEPDFHAAIDDSLRPLWSEFLSANTVIERSEGPTVAAIQRELFTVLDADDRSVHELRWNYVLRRCLEDGSPERWARLILRGLETGHQHLGGIRSTMAATRWVPLAAGGAIEPQRIVDLPNLAEYLGRLTNPEVDGWATETALPEYVTKAASRRSLGEFFARGGDALNVLASWCADKAHWHLGVLAKYLPRDRSEFLRNAEGVGSLQSAALLAELIRNPGANDPDKWAALVWLTLEPAMCRPFSGDKASKRMQYGQVLGRTGNAVKKAVFNAYLMQAIQEGLSDLIPDLSFCSQTRDWLPASKLTWPSAGIEPQFQLCDDQAEILREEREKDLAPEGVDSDFAEVSNRLSSLPDFSAHAQTAVAFLRPFAEGSAGPEVVAALASVLGGNGTMLEFVRELLSRGSRQDPDDFLLDLIGENHAPMISRIRACRFIFEVVVGPTYQAVSLTGSTIEVRLTRDADTLLVGDLSHLWWRRYYDNRKDTECHLVRLRHIEDCESLSSPVDVFAKTIDSILFKVFCNGVRAACPTGISEFVARLHQGQTDLRRSQLYLLDGAESRILNLGLRTDPAFRGIVRDFDAAREASVQAEEMEPRAGHRASILREEATRRKRDAYNALEKLLNETGNPGQAALVTAIRRKMEQFQYTPESMLLELFQNADDACVELRQMRPGDAGNSDFDVHLDHRARELRIVHWGRPINQYLAPDFDGQSRGYHHDLAKMLTLSFSDKAVTRDDEPSSETGKFGLGFKTVFFVADEPEVLSGRLAFRIKGGFFPVTLTAAEIAQIRVSPKRERRGENRTPTVTILSINASWGVFSPSRIDLLPHQLWVCKKVTEKWPIRWVVADDVGLGKTIEAGLILWRIFHLKLVRRMLIMCPASLVTQWQKRMLDMFDIRLTAY